MNPDTGEFIPDDTEPSTIPDDWIGFTLGEIIVVKDVVMKILRVNKSNIVLQPLNTLKESDDFEMRVGIQNLKSAE